MSDYDIDVSKMLVEGERGELKTEIWANITDKNTCQTTKKKIWWEDDNGIHHDETPNLPTNLRDAIDNAWLEKKRKW